MNDLGHDRGDAADVGAFRRWTLGRLLLAATGGLLYALGHVGFGAWPLLFVCLVPWWQSLAGSNGRQTTGLSLLFGSMAYVVGFPWLLHLSERFLEGQAALGFGLWSLNGLWFASGFAAAGLVFNFLRSRRVSTGVAGAVSLVLVETVVPQLFSAPLGAGLIHCLPLAQGAELGGPALLTAGVALANGAFDRLLTLGRSSQERPAMTGPWIAVAGVFGCVYFGGVLRIHHLDETFERATRLRVSLIQANLGLAEKRSAAIQAHREYVAQTRSLLETENPELVVWPETAYVGALRRPLPVDGQLILGGLKVPLIFGASSVFEVDGQRVSTNSAFLVDAGGMIRDVYDKNQLIPIAETLPFRTLWPRLAERFPHAQQFSASQNVNALALDDIRIATPICYEIIDSRFVRQMVNETRPDLFVTIANDAWFGDSQEPGIHLALARLRAIEHRRSIARAANTGISAFVEPSGRIAERTGVNTRETLSRGLPLRDGATLYGRLGNWPAALALLVLAHAMVRRHPSPTRPTGRAFFLEPR